MSLVIYQSISTPHPALETVVILAVAGVITHDLVMGGVVTEGILVEAEVFGILVLEDAKGTSKAKMTPFGHILYSVKMLLLRGENMKKGRKK